MNNLTFKFHFEEKPDQIIICKNTDHISEPFKEYSRIIKENKEDLIFYYKGSSFKFNDCEKNKSFKQEMFCQINPDIPINIIVFTLRKTKNLISNLNFSSSNNKQIISTNKKDNKNSEENESLSSSTKNILQLDKKDYDENNYYNDILCPICFSSAIIINNGIKLKIINCENFHRIPQISYDRIEEINSFPAAKCGKCSIYKSQLTPPENEFYNCICGFYLCPDCIKNHSKDHNKIEIENQNYYCVMHKKDYNLYCFDCNKNICDTCSMFHNEHKILDYQHLKPKEKYIKDITEEVENQKKIVNNFIEKSLKIFNNILKSIKKYINKYISIENTLLNRYNNESLNFQLLQNIRNRNIFYDNIFLKTLKSINNNDEKLNNIDYLKKVLQIYNYINSANNPEKINEDLPRIFSRNEMTMKYIVKEKGINKKVKLFDSVFVDNNKDKLTLFINGKEERQLMEFFNNSSNKDEIIVKIVEKKPVTNMSYMFNNCKNLVAINSKKWDTFNITNMESLFQLCSFESSPDISGWRTQNLKNMKAMFCKCINLKSIPDMYKWNTSNVTDMSFLFNGCVSIESIPKFPSWNTDNLEDMSYMFNRCTNLKELHNIGKLNTEKVKNMCGIFNGCEQLNQLPDISKWNTNNVTNISTIFQFCVKLEKLPDNIYKWNLGNVKDMSGVCSECSNLKNLPNIGKWNAPLVECMSCLFNGCINLNEIPDISKWNTSNVTDMSGMFCDCQSIKKLPDLSEWDISKVTNMSYMFEGCSELRDISSIKNWDMTNIKNITDAFKGCIKIEKFSNSSREIEGDS